MSVGLLDDIKEQQVASRPGFECGTCKLLRTLPKADAADLADALAAKGTYSAASISRALKARGLDVSYQSIMKHRRDRHGE